MNNAHRCTLITVACSLGACTVPIAHTPRIEPGTHSTLVGTLAVFTYVKPDSTRTALPLAIPWFTVREAAATRFGGDSSAGGVEIAAEASLFNGLAGDAYAVAPRRWFGGADVGLGAMYNGVGPFTGPLEYVQIGRRANSRYYVFTTQAVGRVHTQPDGHDALWWQPSIAIQPIDSGPQSRFAFVTLTFGPTRPTCKAILGACLFSPQGAVIVVGAAITPMMVTRSSGRHR